VKSGRPRPSTARNRSLGAPDRAGIGRNRAAHLAVFATILPPLPPITRNVKLPSPANPLQFSIREENALDTVPKSGKNGKVD